MLKRKQLYNVTVTGGNPFRIHPKEGNPVYEHDGVKSMGQLLLDRKVWGEFQDFVSENGAEIERNDSMTMGEHRDERQRRQQMAQLPESVFLTEKCPGCTFCDLRPEGMVCGVENLPKDSMDTLMGTEKGRADLLACPEGKG